MVGTIPRCVPLPPGERHIPDADRNRTSDGRGGRLYRKAGTDERKAAVNMLKGVEEAGSISDFFASIFEGAFGSRQMPQSSVQRLLQDDSDFDFNENFEPLKEITDEEE